MDTSEPGARRFGVLFSFSCKLLFEQLCSICHLLRLLSISFTLVFSYFDFVGSLINLNLCLHDFTFCFFHGLHSWLVFCRGRRLPWISCHSHFCECINRLSWWGLWQSSVSQAFLLVLEGLFGDLLIVVCQGVRRQILLPLVKTVLNADVFSKQKHRCGHLAFNRQLGLLRWLADLAFFNGREAK